MRFTFSTSDPFFILNCGETCELSALNFGRFLRFLQLNNYPIVSTVDKARHVLINSCCVISGKRISVEEKVCEYLSQTHIDKIILFGCFAGIPVSVPERTITLSSKNITGLNTLFAHKIPIEAISVHALQPGFFVPYQRSHDDGIRYILIAQGCENRCSYCNIKNAKGMTVSKPIDEILGEIDSEIALGFFEFILLADDCGSYGADISTTIVDLCWALLNRNKRIKLRIHYLFPKTLIANRDQFAALFATKRITYINVPLQSGSDRILTLMNRHYAPGDVLATIIQLKELSPATWFYTHYIINFPTETDEEFTQTLQAADVFDECLFMNYSANPLTEAARLTEVLPEIREKRIATACQYLSRNGKGLVIDDSTAGPRGTSTKQDDIINSPGR